MSDIFRKRGLSYGITIRARFGSTVCSLVRAGLGIAVIDQFTIAYDAFPGIRVLPIEEAPVFETWIARKAGTALSMFAGSFVTFLREEMARPGQVRPEP